MRSARFIHAITLAIVWVPGVSRAQSWRDAEELAKQLVVMIKAGPAVGAGIICGLDESGVYIATADHVVRQGPDPVKISATFYTHSDQEVEAELLDKRDSDLDVAAIRVTRKMPFWRELQNLPFHYKADPSLLTRGGQVYMLGNPGGRPWRINIRPELLAQVRGELLEFESNLITGGHSGGALLTSDRRIAGMLRSDKPPYGEAVNIDRILERFETWRYPVELRLPLPRVSAGAARTCHLESAGEALCWRMDVLSVHFSHTKISPVAGFRFRDISAGWWHTCGIDLDGKAFCWGSNKEGQLGVGATRDLQESPLPVSGEVTFRSISAGGWHTCALDDEGRAYCWGAGGGGRLGNDSGKSSLVPVAVAGALRFKSLSAGLRHSCGLTESGEIYCWGGILGSGAQRGGMDPPNAFVSLRIATDIKFRSVSAGNGLGCALATDGDGYCWGTGEWANTHGFPERTSLEIVRVPGRLKFRRIVAGLTGHACGITTDRRLYCWGDNLNGQLGNGTKDFTLIPVPVASELRFDNVSPGVGYTCAVTVDGATYCWGAKDSLTPVRLTTLGGGSGGRGSIGAQSERPSIAESGPASPPAILQRYIQVAGETPAMGKLPPRAWKGTLAYPLFGFPDYCGVADVEFREEADGYTLQLSCQVYPDERLSMTLKSTGGATKVTGQVSGRRPYALEKLDEQWGSPLDRDISLFREMLSYPRLIAAKGEMRPARTAIASGQETMLEITRGTGQIDTLHFDSKSGLLAYLSAVPGKGRHTHLEVYFDQYKDVQGVKVPHQIRLNSREAQAVLEIREIQLR